jgi:hypothetical protein
VTVFCSTSADFHSLPDFCYSLPTGSRGKHIIGGQKAEICIRSAENGYVGSPGPFEIINYFICRLDLYKNVELSLKFY